MKTFINYTHDSGVWDTKLLYSDDSFSNFDYLNPRNVENIFKNSKLIDSSNKDSSQEMNQVIVIGKDIFYSSITEKDPNPIAQKRTRVIAQDPSYRLTNNNTIGEIIYPVNYAESPKLTYDDIRETDRKKVLGNLDGLINKDVMRAVLKYIYGKKTSGSKGSLIIEVPASIGYSSGEIYDVDYTAYCRAAIEIILILLPIEMRVGLSFATAPDSKGFQDVLISFEQMGNPINPINSHTAKVYLHDARSFNNKKNRYLLLDDYYISQEDNKIIDACIEDISLPQDFYYDLVNKQIIDCRGQFTQLNEKSFRECFLQFLREREQSKSTNGAQGQVGVNPHSSEPR